MKLIELRTNDDFINAFQLQTPIQVWYDGEPSDTGPIQQLRLQAVVVNGTHYVRWQCQFYIAEEAR